MKLKLKAFHNDYWNWDIGWITEKTENRIKRYLKRLAFKARRKDGKKVIKEQINGMD